MTGDEGNRIRKFCGYRERCTSEVMHELAGWGVRTEAAEKLADELRKEGFLDDGRFARAFAGSKFRINRWGRVKIRMELAAKRIPEPLITLGLQEIGEEDYQSVLTELIEKKSHEIRGEKKWTIRHKLFNFALGKGFESDLVIETLNNLKF
jgi:regulatory protein